MAGKGRSSIASIAALALMGALLVATMGRGAGAFNPQPDPPGRFAFMSLALGQTASLNVLNPGKAGACEGMVTFLDPAGVTLGEGRLSVGPSRGAFLELDDTFIKEVDAGPAPRGMFRAVADLTCHKGEPAPVFSLEISDNDTGKTMVYVDQGRTTDQT